MLKSASLQGARIVVIGAGAVGAAVSYRLAQAGAQVTTVERYYPGAGTTSVSFAWLNGFDKVPKAYHRLNVQSIRDHQDLADELDGHWLRVEGGLHWEHAAEADRVKALHAAVRRLRDWGQRVEQTTPQVAMRELAPDLRIDPDEVSEVFLVPREGTVEPIMFAHGVMHQAVLRYGAKLEHATVTALGGSHGAVDQVVLADGRTLGADVVVNCAGPDADRIAALAGANIPLAPIPGLTLSTAPAPACLRQVVLAPEALVHSDGAGHLILRTREVDGELVPGETPHADSPVTRQVMSRARRIVPGLEDIPVDRVRVGARSMPRDGVSIVGFDPAVVGLYTVVTHSGITLSARLAVLVTEDLATGDCADLAPYRPSRFS